MLATYDIVVIGGGLVGAAIAYGVAAGQRRVAMVDEGDVAYRAARGNFGLIWVQGKGMGLPAYAAWTRLSARRWPEFAAQLRDDTAIDVGLVQTGGLRLLLSEHELIERRRCPARRAGRSA